MKIILKKSFLITLAFILSQELCASSLKIESITAHCMKNELWQEVENLWIVSFFNAYKNFPINRIDNDIQGESEDALLDWLKRLFVKYQVLAVQDSYEFTLVYKDESIVGYTLHHILPQSIMHIDHFAIDPHCQGQGIGKILLSALIKNHPEIKSIVLTTRILNASARRFYKRLGFYEVTEQFDNVKFDPAYSILLKKDID